MAQIINITSEELQATIRRLLPSQQGFGEDLQASNVIMPVIDVTATAEGTQLPSYLQKAISVTDLNNVSVNNGTTTIINTPGFWLLNFAISSNLKNASAENVEIKVSDGISTKQIAKWEKVVNDSVDQISQYQYSEVVYLRTGDSVDVTAGARSSVVGYYRQVATVNGVLINPTGFTFE
jgi:hypothetical protein